MNDQALFDRLARTDAYAPDLPVADEAWTPDVALAEIQRRTSMQTQQTPPTERTPTRRHGWLIAAAAFAVVIIAGVVVALLSATGDDAEPADTPTTTTVAPTTTASPTTTIPTVDLDTLRAATAEYLAAINAGDAEAALAPFNLSEDGVTEYWEGPPAEFYRNQAGFLATLDWEFALSETCSDGNTSAAPGVAGIQCALILDSPVHAALGVEPGESIGSGIVGSFDWISLWHDPSAPVDTIVRFDTEVGSAYLSWMTTNDPDGFAANCDPNLDDNYERAFAFYDRFIFTPGCAEYLNSITDEVLASLDES